MRSSGNTIALVLLVGALGAGVDAQTPSRGANEATTLTDIRREALADAVRVTLVLDAETPFTSERLQQPPRIVIDLEHTRTLYALKDARLTFTDDVVKQVRVGRQSNGSTRVVLDLGTAARSSVYPIYNPYRLVVDIERPGAKDTKPVSTVAVQASKTPATPATSQATVTRASNTPSTSTRSGTTTTNAASAPSATSGRGQAAGTTTTDTSRRPAPASPSANGRGGFSLSRQLGLGISRVVIDPGHGGHDPGARSNGITEAELALDLALRLEARLVKQGVEVVLTRRTSVFIPLEERTTIANQSGADLFLSIHANASENGDARGIETYFLNFAPDAAAEAIAARENAGSSQKMRNLPDMVKAIAMNDKSNESRDLARFVQDGLYQGLKKTNRQVKNLGVKQAPFQVLIGAAMPSILAEISFISNKQEGALLKTDKYRDQIADALAAGVMAYQKAVKKDAEVAER